jgi:hypothetical protein
MSNPKTTPEIIPSTKPEIKTAPDKTSPGIQPDLLPGRDPAPAQVPKELPVRIERPGERGLMRQY